MSLFEDGFESNDFTAWTGTTGAPSVQGGVKHTGLYAMQAAMTGQNYASKTFADQSTCHARGYFRFSGLQGSAAWQQGVMTLRDTGVAQACRAEVNCPTSDNTDFYWSLYDNINSARNTSDALCVIDTWYCVEVAIYLNVNGWIRLWVDDVLESEYDPVDTSSVAHISDLFFGSYPAGYAHTLYGDCAVIDDAYIGLEAAAGGTGSPGGVSSIMGQLVVNRLV